MIDIEVDRFPIVILANFRTGSTVLAKYLSKKYNIPFYSEPFHNKNIATLDLEKIKYLKNTVVSKTDKFILKMMPAQISYFNNYFEVLTSDGFKIKLNRVDKINQMVSLYISLIRDKWNKIDKEPEPRYSIPIDKTILQEAITTISINDFIFDILNIKFDMVINYEDLGIIEEVEEYITDKPDNYEEIRQEVVNLLKWKWDNLKEKLC